jgi:hypothetical protein
VQTYTMDLFTSTGTGSVGRRIGTVETSAEDSNSARAALYYEHLNRWPDDVAFAIVRDPTGKGIYPFFRPRP